MKAGIWQACMGLMLGLVLAGQALAYKGTIACGSWQIGGINLQCAGPDGNQAAGWPGWAVLSVAAGKDVLFGGGGGDGGTASAPFGNVGVYGANKVNATGSAVI